MIQKSEVIFEVQKIIKIEKVFEGTNGSESISDIWGTNDYESKKKSCLRVKMVLKSRSDIWGTKDYENRKAIWGCKWFRSQKWYLRHKWLRK